MICHFGLPIDAAALERAVEEASFEHMRAREQGGEYQTEGQRFGNMSGIPEGYKVRQGKVGGYIDYCTEDTIAWMEDCIERSFPQGFGYRVNEERTMDASSRTISDGARLACSNGCGV